MAALSTTNARVVNQGGGIRKCHGQFTSAIGDDVATITLPGSVVLTGSMYANTSSAGDYMWVPFRWTASNNVLTITAAATVGITDGYYCFETL